MSSPDQDPRLTLLDRYWRAANYLSAGQIYLMSNPLLQEPLEAGHIKPRLLGHWGTTPGLNFIYAHLNRIITARDVSLLYICGPGHGGPGMVANTWLEGSYSEVYPDVPENAEGMQRLFKQFSFPGGVPSHAAPETPGSVNEGGELGYALSHAFGAAFDHPDLIVPCVIGDGEAETGALAASWPGIRFLNPVRDGAVLPILHLNGYKIASPTLLGRSTNHELRQLFSGHGYYPVFVSGRHPAHMHRQMAEALDEAFDRISAIQQQARAGGAEEEHPRWPMIILRSPKGWTGPAEVDGKKVEDFWRAHQVPVSACREDEGHRQILEQWLRSYRPQELFDAEGRLMPELRALAPVGDRRMGSSPYANGGGLRRPLKTANVTAYAQAIGLPGATQEEPTACLGRYLSQVFRDNPANFRLFSPDETESNRLGAVFDVTGRRWMGEVKPFDEQLDREGRVMETLSEHQCQGWLEGYLLTGRHGLFSCYEAFIHIIGSMFNQHAKWLKVSRKLAWRKPVSSLNYLLSSHVWRQDNNGFSHQDPGFLDHVACKKPDIVRIYLPPDANTLLCVTDHCLNTWDRINVIVAGKHAAPQWLDIDSAIRHCEAGMGEWTWAGNTPEGSLPDVVMACAGDVPTLETLAAVDFLRTHLPALRVRVVNVVDLLALQPEDEHPHGKSGAEFEKLFTPDRPVIFAFHGYPGLIHRLTSQRPHHRRLRVHGYREEGSTTTPFDMTVVNGLSRFHLAKAAVLSVEGLAARYPAVLETLRECLEEHHRYVREQGEDLPAIRDWQWPQPQDDGRPVRAR